jgi:hypothetical protein
MVTLIEIQFLKSRSKNYPDVVKHAGLFFDFTAGENNILKIDNIQELFGRWDDFSIVIFGATKWAGTNVFFCGKPVLPYTNDFFYLLLDVKNCYDNFSKDIALSFCTDSNWGCRQLKNIKRYLNEINPYRLTWYNFGSFSDKNTWRIDKVKLLAVLKNESEGRMCSHCPAFFWENISKKVNSLPDEIKAGEHWEILYQLDHNVNGPANIAIGVTPVIRDQPTKIVPIQEDFDFDNLTDDQVNDLIEKYLRGKQHQ